MARPEKLPQGTPIPAIRGCEGAGGAWPCPICGDRAVDRALAERAECLEHALSGLVGLSTASEGNGGDHC